MVSATATPAGHRPTADLTRMLPAGMPPAPRLGAGTPAKADAAAATPAARAPAAALLEGIPGARPGVTFARDQEIVADGTPATECWDILSGCVRLVSLTDDGRRQVTDLLFPGDILGLEALDTFDYSAEAITAATLRRVPRRAVEGRAAADAAFACTLRRMMAERMRATRARLVMLGRMSATQRIAHFLLEMQARIGTPGSADFELPMNRSDIADYLGLTIETVCRGLTDMRRRQLIAVSRTRITLRDASALPAALEHLH